ncbi:MAG: dihydropyrimidinase [Ktedonobacteraceae bacterium]
MRTLITNGHIVTAIGEYTGDVLIDNQTIAAISAPGAFASLQVDSVLDAQGKYIFPGAIDVHTHMELPLPTTVASDSFETGTIAAACGGTTTILDFANQQRGHTLAEALQAWHTKADGNAVIDYGFHITITDLAAAPEDAMAEMISAGVTTFKLLMAYPGTFMVDDDTIYRVLRRSAELGGLVMIHAENGIVIDLLVREAIAAGHTAPGFHALTRPAILEGEATSRAITLATLAQAPLYIVHVSCAHSLRAVATARAKGLPVWGETCPQYLYLNDSHYAAPSFEAAKFVCTPPMRSISDNEALWLGLQRHELQVVSTDHAPFNFAGQKELGLHDFSKIPNGLPGVEHRVMLMYDAVRTGKISLPHFVDLIATTPAKLFGLFPRKGTLAPGSDADIVIFDPNATATITAATQHQRVDYTPYEGMLMQGSPDTVFLRGRIIVQNGQYIGGQGGGQYLHRQTFEEIMVIE